MSHSYIRLDAGNDSNGNPRRLFVVFDSRGNTCDVIDEGYSGYGEVRKHYRTAADLGTYKTTPAQYRELLKEKRETERMMRGRMGRR
jgi:hypothetical protein